MTKLVARARDAPRARRRHRRRQRRRADRRGRAGDRGGPRRRGHRADDPPAPDAVGDDRLRRRDGRGHDHRPHAQAQAARRRDAPTRRPGAGKAPRYTGIRTFAPRAARAGDRTGVDVAGARRPVRHRDVDAPGRALRARRRSATPRCCCGPGIRSHAIDVFGALSVRRRAATSPPRPATRSAPTEQIADGARPRAALRARRRSCSAATTRSCSASCARTPPRTGRSALVLLDAHADTWDELLRRALLPRHAVPARAGGGADRPGALAARRDARLALRGRPTSTSRASWGFEIVPVRRAARAGRRRSTPRACARGVGDGPAFLSFDIDVHRPGVRARAPARPRSAACSPHEAIALPARAARACASPASTSSRSHRPTTPPPRRRRSLAANIGYELLALTALSR